MDFSDSQRGDKEILIFLLPIQVSSDLDCSGLMTLYQEGSVSQVDLAPLFARPAEVKIGAGQR